jgi:hypothetical protein
LAQYNQCYAQVKAFLAAQEANAQRDSQATANREAISDAVNNVATVLTGGDLPAQPADSGSGLSNTDVVNAYGHAISIDFKGIAENWIEEIIPESRHGFDAWKAVDFAKSVGELQNGDPSVQIKGIGGVAKGLLDVHWGMYELNPLSAAISQRMIDVTTTLYGEAFNNFDQGMATALSELSTSPNPANNWDFNRTQAPISVPYVSETPPQVVEMSSASSDDQDQDVGAEQFHKLLERPR